MQLVFCELLARLFLWRLTTIIDGKNRSLRGPIFSWSIQLEPSRREFSARMTQNWRMTRMDYIGLPDPSLYGMVKVTSNLNLGFVVWVAGLMVT